MLRILVPTDFSACSEAALDYALFIARRFRAEVDLLYVWSLNAKESRALFFADSIHGIAMERALTRADDGPTRVRGRVEFGDLCSTIVHVAKEGFDLVVLGLHGHRRITHMFQGHVAMNVARRTTCPVITVRAFLEPHLQRGHVA